MIFTDRFVYVHELKTGGTFVTSALFRLYGLKWTRRTHLRDAVFREARARHPKYGALVHDSNKHGLCRSIPAAHKAKARAGDGAQPFRPLRLTVRVRLVEAGGVSAFLPRRPRF